MRRIRLTLKQSDEDSQCLTTWIAMADVNQAHILLYTLLCIVILYCSVFFCVKNRLCRQAKIIASDLWIYNSSEHFGFYEPNAKIEGGNMYPYQNV